MRSIIGITLVLLAIGSVLCRWGESTAPAPQATVAASWIRTVDGWERAASWQRSATPPPRLHPLIVAAGQALVSIFALVAATPSVRPAGQQTPRRKPMRRRAPHLAAATR